MPLAVVVTLMQPDSEKGLLKWGRAGVQLVPLPSQAP